MNIVPFLRGDTNRAFGGAEVQTRFLIDALGRRGVDLRLVVSDLGHASLDCEAIEAFDSSRGLPGFRFVYPRLIGIWRALARADADVYYQRNAGMITGVVAAFCRAHDRVFVYGAGSDVDFSWRRVSIDSLRDRTMFRAGLRLCHGVVVQNRDQERAARSLLGSRPVRVIPNGTALAHQARVGTPRHVAWIGALRRIKRPDLVLELAARLPEVRFVVVGGPMAGEPEVGRMVEARARELPNVRLAGRLGHEQVLEVLRDSIALVNTSDAEGFPNAYLEAWAHGVPVVTRRDVDGLVEGEGAGVVGEGIDELAAALRRVTTDRAFRDAMGERGRRLVRERFGPDAIADQYLEFFESLGVRGARETRSAPVGVDPTTS